MGKARTLLLGLGGAAALWIGWGAYSARRTERVHSETIDRFDGVELRQYPQTVLLETTAADAETAFRRLAGYLQGDNEAGQTFAMTAPVAVRPGVAADAPPVTVLPGETDSETFAPTRTQQDGDFVTMSFHLPANNPEQRLPSPTDANVRIVVEPPRRTAALSFSWYATDERVERARDRLLRTVDDRDLTVDGDPVLLQYDDPWTPPFMRTNEVEVPIAPD